MVTGSHAIAKGSYTVRSLVSILDPLLCACRQLVEPMASRRSR